MESEPIVFIVDDEPGVLKALEMLMKSVGRATKTYLSAEAFLKDYDASRPGCLVLDVRMTGMSGLELQQRLDREGVGIPIVMITGHGDVPMAVQAMRDGAVGFIEKPFKDETLLTHIRQALDLDQARRRQTRLREEVHARLARLSPRERQVMDLMVSGKTNKEIARDLGVTPRTVEVHRAHVRKKMEADSVAEMVRMVSCIDPRRVTWEWPPTPEPQENPQPQEIPEAPSGEEPSG